MLNSIYGDVVVVNSERLATKLSIGLRDVAENVRRDCFAGDNQVGWFYLYRDDDVSADKVLEVVMSKAGDRVVSVYVNHPIFQSRSELMHARRALIKAISKERGLSVESIGVEDPTRGRLLGLDELATGQLIDLLHEQAAAGALVTTADGYTPDNPI